MTHPPAGDDDRESSSVGDSVVEWTCSFCGHQGRGTVGVVAGPKVFICKRCTTECLRKLSEPAPASSDSAVASGWHLENSGVRCSFCYVGIAPEPPVLGRAGANICRNCVRVCEGIFREQPSGA
jgi:ATP-dependent protease Clp ATPase subunit